MSDTPRTDALIATFKTEGNEFAWLEDLKDLCRELERGQSARPEVARSGETPRTEAMIESCGDYEKAYHYNGRFAEFARQLERELAEARFRPIGDNHHNALACPYCTPSPPLRSQEEKS